MRTPQITIETITPEMAAELLEMSDLSNRKLRPHVVNRYAADMTEGRWMLTGEPIIVNGTTLINGHHRLTACVQSGTPFTSAVFRGADRSVYNVVDSGLARTTGDVLAHAGHANANIVAAAVRLVLGYRSNTLYDAHSWAVAANRLTMQDEAESNRERYQKAVNIGINVRKEGFNPSALAAFAVLLGEHVQDDDRALEFGRSLVAGVGLDAGDPRLAMRRWVLSARRMNNIMHLSAFVRCWNAYDAHKSLTIIRPWVRGTPFPVLEG